ncbi:Transposase [Arachidicoccus rhizosphaerae]|uniref:Transposase n=1 Tax=Arachidicoccus rhizosphaerae TaxID=551991 RepID=A0A1H4CKJ2_9BACT|nr:helix-turn-helix domain-containing protein [Arachidicoccus rhizosphaerae]SEA32085.1 Transposase [Arachidicoccus rhizosphaerae]SEA42305.1 Transposase [Arachidicoccus rhizosphaerae]SEA60951.1 Transposase [Arachidicoccus rhizosphaerae]
MKKLVIHNQSKIKKQILSYFQSTEDLKLSYRLHCILMLIENETLSCEDVAKLHGTTPQTIARWIHAFNKTGGDISVLKDKEKPGRAPRVSEVQLNIISDVLKKDPREYGIKADRWEGSTLSELLKQKFNIDLKIRQCQRIMKKLGLANKKGRDWSNRPPEQ